MPYIKCPRCHLNYILDTEKFCKVCLVDMHKLSQESVISEDFGEENEELRLCPECHENYLEEGEELCYACRMEQMKAAAKENAVLISLEGETVGIIIGHRGETLDSIQYLTSLAASNNGGGYFKVTINIGNYREKREEALVNLAKRVSEQVIRTGRCRSLEPMNPYERRIIHTAVQEINGVVSNSFGEGTARRVVIGIEGGEMRPPRKNGRDFKDGGRRRAPSKAAPASASNREPKKDNDAPLYGKIN